MGELTLTSTDIDPALASTFFTYVLFSGRAEDRRNIIDPANGMNIIARSQISFVVGSINLFFVSFTIEMIHNKIFNRLNSVQSINPTSGARSSMLFCRI
jgi:hypothetical protein